MVALISHTMLRLGENQWPLQPLVADLFCDMLPSPPSLAQRRSGICVCHVLFRYVKRGGLCAINAAADARVRAAAERECNSDVDHYGEALTRDDFDVCFFDGLSSSRPILGEIVLVVWFLVVVADHCGFDVLELDHGWCCCGWVGFGCSVHSVGTSVLRRVECGKF